MVNSTAIFSIIFGEQISHNGMRIMEVQNL
jgi:hypothetical protein